MAMAAWAKMLSLLLIAAAAVNSVAACDSCGDEPMTAGEGLMTAVGDPISRKLLQTCGANASPVKGVCTCNKNNIPVPRTFPLACCRPNAILVGDPVGGVCKCKTGTTFTMGSCVPNACVNKPQDLIVCLVDPERCVTAAYCNCKEASDAGASLARNCVRPLNLGGVDGEFCCGF